MSKDRHNEDVTQAEKFQKAARDLGTDQSEKAFDAVVKKIAMSARHASDCAVNAAPALEPGPCDCGAITAQQ